MGRRAFTLTRVSLNMPVEPQLGARGGVGGLGSDLEAAAKKVIQGEF